MTSLFKELRMSNHISSFPLSIHTKTHSSYFEQIKNCFDAVTQCVIDIFKKIGEFFYNLFHTKAKPSPAFQAEVLQPVNENPPVPEVEMNRVALENGPKAEVPQPLNENLPVPEVEINRVPLEDDAFIKELKDTKHPIVGFYLENIPNDEGLTIDQILNADDNFLEQNDHWIDWVFPTTIRSFKTAAAPVLDFAIIQKIRASRTMQNKVRSVFRRVLRFYGLREGRRLGVIERDAHFAEAAKNWLTVDNYNFLRITQIIHSLGLMIGRPNNNGYAFIDILKDISKNEGKGIINKYTIQRWNKAIEAEVVFTY